MVISNWKKLCSPCFLQKYWLINYLIPSNTVFLEYFLHYNLYLNQEVPNTIIRFKCFSQIRAYKDVRAFVNIDARYICALPPPPSSQTRDVDVMLIKCWSIVQDVDPALNQHCFNIRCFSTCFTFTLADNIDALLSYQFIAFYLSLSVFLCYDFNLIIMCNLSNIQMSISDIKPTLRKRGLPYFRLKLNKKKYSCVRLMIKLIEKCSDWDTTSRSYDYILEREIFKAKADIINWVH